MPSEQLAREFRERARKILRAYPRIQGNQPITRGVKEQIRRSVNKLVRDVADAHEALEELGEDALSRVDNLVQSTYDRMVQYESAPSADGGRRKTRGKRIMHKRRTTRR